MLLKSTRTVGSLLGQSSHLFGCHTILLWIFVGPLFPGRTTYPHPVRHLNLNKVLQAKDLRHCVRHLNPNKVLLQAKNLRLFLNSQTHSFLLFFCGENRPVNICIHFLNSMNGLINLELACQTRSLWQSRHYPWRSLAVVGR